MHSLELFLNLYKQNHKLPIRLISPSFGHLPAELTAVYGPTHRKPHYFFILMLKGVTNHGVDLRRFEIKENELLFILPHQIHQLPTTKEGTDYFKLGFDDHCLSLLPRPYPFLLNPFNNQQILFTPSTIVRLRSIFGILEGLLSVQDADPELILVHLNSLLTEINTAYFAGKSNPADRNLAHYIRFKLFVENNLSDHHPVNIIAEQLALNTNSLYTIVKHFSGLSPKEFITNRLILEAKRRLYYSESSIKELAYDLGFNDPEYFSRLFKKVTGTTISGFVQDLSGN